MTIPHDSPVRIATETRHPGRESPELHSVFLRRKVSSATPGFVAHAPEAHVERIFESGRRAHIRQGRAARGRVAVFDPAVEFFRGQTAQVRRQIRLAADQLAEVHELVSAELDSDRSDAKPELPAPRPDSRSWCGEDACRRVQFHRSSRNCRRNSRPENARPEP